MVPRALPHDLVGTGDHPVLVLHGWLGDRSSFDAMRPYLDTEGFTYALVDYRGYGEAMDREGAYTVAEAGADALATATALGWDSFSVIGHSMGGLVAQHALLAEAHRIRSLVGISPVPASGVELDEQARALFAGAADEPGNRRTIINMTTGDRLPARWLDAAVHRSWTRSTRSAVARYQVSFTESDLQRRIAGNTTPVLVLAGAHDPALSPDVLRDTWARWYPNAELDVFADAGHYAPEELPLPLVSRIERFLTR